MNLTSTVNSHMALNFPSSNPECPAWEIWFDGSAHPNPGRIGLGVFLREPGGRRHEFSTTASTSGCNNEAELLALEQALFLARTLGALSVVLHSDSDFVVKHVNGLAHTEVLHLKALIQRVRRQLEGFPGSTLIWIPRHRNSDADRLSRAALGLPDKPGLHPGLLRRRR